MAISENDKKVKALLRNINRQAELAIMSQELARKQQILEEKILGDEIPEFDGGFDDLREEVAMATEDGGEMTMEALLSILTRAKEKLARRAD